jgi:hypothetical protein
MKDRIEIWAQAQLELEKLHIEQKELCRKADRIHRTFEILAISLLISAIFSLLQF